MKRYFASVLLALFLLILFRFGLEFDSVRFSDLAIYDQVLMVLGVLSAFGFWFMMLADFFKNDQIKNRVFWGFSMIFFSWIASIFYFVKYFIPKHKP